MKCKQLMMRSIAWWQLGVLTIVAAGCGGGSDLPDVALHPVRGAIKFEGKPIAGAIVSLHPRSATTVSVPNPRASVQPDGTFQLSTFGQNDGAPTGEYVLTVQWFRPVDRNGDITPGPNVLPRKYAKPNTSDIVVRVAEGTNEVPPITLR